MSRTEPDIGDNDKPEGEALPLVAYYADARPQMRIVPAPRWRAWMNDTVMRNANRCLPLLTANEAGWVLLNPQPFSAEWSGDDDAGDLKIHYDRAPVERAVSIFGYGILSFRIPYLFRTPPGWDLLARGPANLPRDGIAPLEGLIETDWACSTFTMNWKFTRPGTVTFAVDEPICMVVPQSRGALESFVPDIQPEAVDEGVAAGWGAFRRNRHDIQVRKFLSQYTDAHADVREAWEGDYFRGRTADGRPAPEHLTKRRLKDFPDPAA